METARSEFASAMRRHALALTGYVLVAVAFAWPLPLHLTTALPGPVSGDTGVYVWNLWVFRHAITAHREMPFFTAEILSLASAVPLTLQNYTTLANAIAYPLLPLFGIVATFNLLVIGSGVVAAHAMFVCARRLTGDTGAAWVAGLAFGFSPFMSARATEHFSLVQTAPLPIFVMLLERLHFRPTFRVAAAAGITVACAFLCDPYYAVYCLVIGGFAIAYSAVLVQRGPLPFRPYRGTLALDVLLVCIAGLIGGMLVGGGRRIEVFTVRISMTRLYTPVLLFTVLALARLWIIVRSRISWVFPTRLPSARVLLVSGGACVVLLSPVLSALVGAAGESQWSRPTVLWQSSAPGLDLFSLFVPNPLHPWLGRLFAEGARSMPGGFVENVASIPWTLIAVLVAAAACTAATLPRYWLAFTLFAGCLALEVGDVAVAEVARPVLPPGLQAAGAAPEPGHRIRVDRNRFRPYPRDGNPALHVLRVHPTRMEEKDQRSRRTGVVSGGQTHGKGAGERADLQIDRSGRPRRAAAGRGRRERATMEDTEETEDQTGLEPRRSVRSAPPARAATLFISCTSSCGVCPRPSGQWRCAAGGSASRPAWLP